MNTMDQVYKRRVMIMAGNDCAKGDEVTKLENKQIPRLNIYCVEQD